MPKRASDQSKRILYVDMAPSVGGSIISLYHLVRGLDRTRFRPSVILRTGNDYAARFEALGATVETVSAGYTGAAAPQSPKLAGLRQSRLSDWVKRLPGGEAVVHGVGFYARTWPELRREARALRTIMDQLRPDLVHLNDVVGVSRSGIMAAHGARIPAICHLRALSTRTGYDRMISRWLRGFICISRAVDRHQRTLGGRSDPSWVVYNGIDPDEYVAGPTGPDRETLRRELGLAPDDFVVGCLGRIRPWKGQHILLEALALLHRRYPRIKGLIVGLPEVHEMVYGDAMRELARELGLGERVVFAGYRRDVPDVLRCMDLMAHTSVRPEPFGRVIIESMAAGTPVVATDAGAVPEIVRDGQEGLLVPPDDAAALAAAIERVHNRPEEAKSWVAAGERVVRERFTVAHYVQGIEKVYEELLSD